MSEPLDTLKNDDEAIFDDIASLDSDLQALGEKESLPEEKNSNKEKNGSEAVDKYPPRAMRQRTPKLETIPTKSTSTQKKPKPEKKQHEEEEEYEIERIEAHRIQRGKVVEYEIKWKGYPSSQNTTEKADTIHADVYDLCAAYWDKQPNLTRPSNAPKSIQSKASPTVDSQTTPSRKESRSSKTAGPQKRSHNRASSEHSKRPRLQEEDELRTERKSTPKATKQPTEKIEQLSESEGEDVEEVKEVEEVEEVEEAEEVEEVEESEEVEEVDYMPTEDHKKYAKHVPDYMKELGYKFDRDFPPTNAEWNRDIIKVCVQASPIDSKQILCYAEWNNGKKTIHTMSEAHEKIPQLLIKYYEDRLQFL